MESLLRKFLSTSDADNKYCFDRYNIESLWSYVERIPVKPKGKGRGPDRGKVLGRSQGKERNKERGRKTLLAQPGV